MDISLSVGISSSPRITNILLTVGISNSLENNGHIFDCWYFE
jgi:hypothetical protein